MRSDAELLSLVPVSEREKFLKTLRTEQLEALKWNRKFWGRPDQLPPRGDWVTWFILAGRGWGKTVTGDTQAWIMDTGTFRSLVP